MVVSSERMGRQIPLDFVDWVDVATGALVDGQIQRIFTTSSTMAERCWLEESR